MTMTIGAVASGKSAAANGSVRFNATTAKYSRSATGIGGAFTWTFWVKIAVDRNAFTIFLDQDGAGGYYFMAFGSNGTVLVRDSTSGAGVNTGFNPTVGTWLFVGCVNDPAAGGSDLLGWKPAGGSWDSWAVSTGITVTGPADANTFVIGGDTSGSFLNGSIAALKVWSVALTDAELQAEAATYAPVKTSGLWATYSFRNGPQTTDDSGNGRTLTQAGTPVLDAAGPPIT